MPEPQFSTASGEVKPDEVMLTDVLKPTNLIIALIASVLFILLGWYLLVLKPALSESFPIDIRPTKKPSSNTPFSQELTLQTKVETKLINDVYVGSNAALEKEEKKSEVVQPSNPIRRTKSTQRITSRKSAKANIAINKKEPPTQTQDFSHLQNEYKEPDKKEENMRAENMTVEENQDEDAVQKIKSAGVKLKESFLTPVTQPICTQVQIAMNQCPN